MALLIVYSNLYTKKSSYNPAVRSSLVTVRIFYMLPLCFNTLSAPPTMTALEMPWWGAGRPLGSSVLLCGSQLWPGLCNTPISHIHISPTVNPTKHKLYTHTQQNVVPVLTMTFSVLIMCFINDYSCVLWSASACVAQLLVTGTKCIQLIYFMPLVS